MARKIDYLFRRKGSDVWQLRLQFPKSVMVIRPRMRDISMQTKDYNVALIKASDLIKAHRIALLENHNMSRTDPPGTHCKAMEPRTRTLEDDAWFPTTDGIEMVSVPAGALEVVTEQKAMWIVGSKVVHELANRDYFFIDTAIVPEDVAHRYSDLADPAKRELHKARRDDDGDAVIDRWIVARRVNTHLAREARVAFRKFREAVTDRPLAACTRADGRALVAALFDQGDAFSTVQKKVGHLRSACNVAIDDGTLSNNPFTRVMPERKKGDSTVRLPMDDEDMALANNALPTWREDESLLWRICAATGMRRGEAWQIEREHIEGGVRFVIVGTKSEASERRVPLPECLSPFLPKRITTRLFAETPEVVSKRLLRRIRVAGIIDPAKVIHSLRHRAKDRLRSTGCPLDVQYHLLGHEEVTVAKGYGRGYPVAVLKRFIDGIGLG